MGARGESELRLNKLLCSLHLHLFCGFEELSIRHLCLGDIVFSFVQDLREPAQGTSLSRLYNWGLNLHSFISTTLCVHSVLSELGSSGLTNPEVPSSPTV